jgi:hypothetical protein
MIVQVSPKDCDFGDHVRAEQALQGKHQLVPRPLTDACRKSILDHAQSNRTTFFGTRRSTGWHGQGLKPELRNRR